MGLDITAYRKVELVQLESTAAPGRETGPGETRLWLPDGLPDRSDGVLPGWYRPSEERYSFQAGSYGGYGDWRRWLSKTFLGATPEEVWDDQARFAGKPFVELVNYADNEGYFGPETSSKLARDFAAHEPPGEYGSWNVSRYQHWARALALAAHTGVVKLT